MHTLHEEANAKCRANIFAKNDVFKGVGVWGVGVQREVGVKCGCVQGCCVVWVRGWECPFPRFWSPFLSYPPPSHHFLSLVWKTQHNHWTKQMVSTRLRWGWVFLERTRILSGIQFTTHFIEFFVVETKRFVGSFVNVILTRQTCGQRSSRAAESKRRALGNYFSKRICYMFLISKFRGD